VDAFGQHATQDVQRALQPLAQVHRRGLDDLLAGIRQQLLVEVGGALSGFQDAVQVVQDGLVLYAPARQLRVANHGGQHIVEVVRNPARQPADALQAVGAV
jgi:hypothetical protein